MKLPLQCRCGTLKGHIDPPSMADRAICYCKDCQAFAHFLERADEVLDAQGGTTIVAMLPQHVHFTSGTEALSAMSLSPKGLYRWYARCCNTPVGNTPRDVKTPYVGIVHRCLADDTRTLDRTFGPVKMRLNVDSAKGGKGTVKSTPLATALAIARLMRSMLPARLNGSYKDNPFFKGGSNEPVVPPVVLSKEERARVTPA